MSYLIRSSVPADIPALKLLWHTVFGDDMDDIDRFFLRFYTPEAAIVAEIDGLLTASGYLLPLGSAVMPDGRETPCHVTYALGTLPDYRGHGCAAAITREAVTRCSGKSLSLICPAEDTLFDYYAGKAGYRDFFYCRSTEFFVSSSPGSSSFCAVSPLSVPEYAQLREKLLAGRFHIRFSEKALEYQRELCGERGGFFTVTVAGLSCCAAAEVSGDETKLKEFLPIPGLAEDAALSALCEALGTERCAVRRPSQGVGTPGEARFAMLIPDAAVLPPIYSVSPPSSPPWFGFAFD